MGSEEGSARGWGRSLAAPGWGVGGRKETSGRLTGEGAVERAAGRG